MFPSGSYKDAWQARYQDAMPYFKIRCSDRLNLSRWRRNADTTSADPPSLESGRIRHRMAQSICCVILQAASSCIIILYDPTHPRQQKDGDVLKVRSNRCLEPPRSIDTSVCSHRFAPTLKSIYQIPLRTPRPQHLSSRASFTLLRLGHSISCTRMISTRTGFSQPVRRSQSYFHSPNLEL